MMTLSSRFARSKLVILHTVTFINRDDFVLHQNLRAIDNNTLITMLTPRDLAGKDELLLSNNEIILPYIDFPEIIENTRRLMDCCSIDYEYGTNKNKQIFAASRYDDKILLEKLAFDGMVYRYGKHDKKALQRVNHELEIIDKLGFSTYFLIAWDIVRYSMSRGFHHVGRGSGANSVVAYCLKITDVDPSSLIFISNDSSTYAHYPTRLRY